MWLSHDCSWIVTAACFSGDKVSLWTGARSNLWISSTALRLFCYCHFVIRQDHGFSSPREPHLLIAGLGVYLVASTRSTLVIGSVLLFVLLLFFKLWLCRALIAAGAFLTDGDRFPWKSQSEFCVVRATHKFKSLGFVCSPSFSPLRLVSPFSREVIFTRARYSLLRVLGQGF